MSWAVFLAVLGSAVVVGAAWLLVRPRPAEHLVGAGEVPDADAPPEPARHRSAAAGFAPQVRGYRMDQVDTVLDSLESRIAAHDRSIARLRGDELPEPPARPAARPGRPDSSPAALAVRTDRPAPGAVEDEPPPRPGPAAGRDDAPAAGRPLPLRRSDLWAPAGLPPRGDLGPLRAGRLAAHRLPVAGRPGPAGVRVVLRGRRPQPDQPGQPAVQRPAELPRRREPDGQRGGAGPGHPPGAADPARRPVRDVPRRRAARAGPHGLRVVLAVPAAPGRAPARRRHRRRLRGLRTRHGVARQRAPQLRRAVPRPRHRRPGAAPRRRPSSGARRRRARPPRRLAGADRRGGAAPHRRGAGHRRPRPTSPTAGPTCGGCCPDSASLPRSASPSSPCPCGGSSPGRRATATSGTHRAGTTSPSSGGGRPAASAPTRGPRPRCR